MTDTALRENLARLATAVGDECKAIRLVLNGNAPDLASLHTLDKTNLVNAINELKAGLAQSGTAVIDDTKTRSDRVWSSQKVTQQIGQEVSKALQQVIGGAPDGLNTLEELAASMGNQVHLNDILTNGLAARVRTDTATQGLDATQRQNARKNIDAAGIADLGPDIDYAAVFRTGLIA